ncbi:MAG: hypothetical protein BWY50_01815 [Spirochaetes bacterium ADurb.Bin315]|nr:MAG: hypothetical protein BWY50_01815 [Spirochaetes bacterium ADurb.Bin315]
MIKTLPGGIDFRFQGEFRLLLSFLYRFGSFTFVFIILKDRGIFILLITLKLFKIIFVLIFLIDRAELFFQDFIIVKGIFIFLFFPFQLVFQMLVKLLHRIMFIICLPGFRLFSFQLFFRLFIAGRWRKIAKRQQAQLTFDLVGPLPRCRQRRHLKEGKGERVINQCYRIALDCPQIDDDRGGGMGFRQVDRLLFFDQRPSIGSAFLDRILGKDGVGGGNLDHQLLLPIFEEGVQKTVLILHLSRVVHRRKHCGEEGDRKQAPLLFLNPLPRLFTLAA